MFLQYGKFGINTEVNLTREEFFELAKGKLNGIDIKEAYKEYSYHNRKVKKKKEKKA